MRKKQIDQWCIYTIIVLIDWCDLTILRYSQLNNFTIKTTELSYLSSSKNVQYISIARVFFLLLILKRTMGTTSVLCNNMIVLESRKTPFYHFSRYLGFLSVFSKKTTVLFKYAIVIFFHNFSVFRLLGRDCFRLENNLAYISIDRLLQPESTAGRSSVHLKRKQ